MSVIFMRNSLGALNACCIRYTIIVETMLVEHHAIFDHLLSGCREAAMAALEAHVRRSLEPNIERLCRLAPLPEKFRTPFLVQVDEPASGATPRSSRSSVPL
jgi:hypothetical protein